MLVPFQNRMKILLKMGNQKNVNGHRLLITSCSFFNMHTYTHNKQHWKKDDEKLSHMNLMKLKHAGAVIAKDIVIISLFKCIHSK